MKRKDAHKGEREIEGRESSDRRRRRRRRKRRVRGRGGVETSELYIV
jgi:hypothetical protein